MIDSGILFNYYGGILFRYYLQQQEYHREYRHKENHKQKFKHDRLVLIRPNTIIGM